jgi:hypothetical protein
VHHATNATAATLAILAARAAAAKKEVEGKRAGESGPTFVNPNYFFIWSARIKIVLMLSYLICKCGGLRPHILSSNKERAAAHKSVSGWAGSHEQGRVAQLIYIIKEFIQQKMNLNKREFLIWKEIVRGVRARDGQGQAGIFKVSLSWGEI